MRRGLASTDNRSDDDDENDFQCRILPLSKYPMLVISEALTGQTNSYRTPLL